LALVLGPEHKVRYTTTMRLVSSITAASTMLLGVLVACSESPPGANSSGSSGMVAALPSNTDGVRNGTETDIDCGGGMAPKCGNAKRCLAATDCSSNVCVGKFCQGAGVGDGVQNGTETDVDCGGGMAPKCIDGKKCGGASDCESALCVANACVALTSTDGMKNGSETDVDCGGGKAPKCADLKVCNVAADCSSSVCTGNACQVPTSTDNVKNGDESDVDCGGSSTGAAKCVLAKTCNADLDCDSTICSNGKKCTEAPSCRPVFGGETCGEGETGTPGAKHDSCCKSLPVAGLTMVQDGVTKQVYLDKYEITAGRVRAWLADIKTNHGNNIRAWVQARIAVDPILSRMYGPATLPYAGQMIDFLPAGDNGETKPIPVHPTLQATYGGAIANVDIGINSQIGPTSYYRGINQNGTSGCSMALGNSGHRTVWTDDATRASFGEPSAGNTTERDRLDEKSANCMTPIMFAAFCAWDGGYVMTQDAFMAAFGPATLPWGEPAAGLTMNQDAAGRSNYNMSGLGNLLLNPPRYNYPRSTMFANSQTQLIAAPGRFPLDLASVARPGQETWMDISGNMLEWYFNVTAARYQGWGGSSFEGHAPLNYGKTVYGLIFMDKYGKGSTRCVRLK
jgi:hypothetical protein